MREYEGGALTSRQLATPRPPQVRTPGEGGGSDGASPRGADEVSVSFDLGAELLAQRAQELFALTHKPNP